MHSEFPNVHWETKVAKNDLQDLQKSFNHSSSTIFIKFGFHFWRKCLLACLKVFFPFARWGQIQTTITVCDSRFGGFFFFLPSWSLFKINHTLLFGNTKFVDLSWLFSTGILVSCTLNGGQAHLQDCSILCQKADNWATLNHCFDAKMVSSKRILFYGVIYVCIICIITDKG